MVEQLEKTSILISDDREPGGILTFILRKGDKSLVIGFDDESSTAATRLEKVNAVSREPGATTELYREVINILQQLANDRGQPIGYSVLTSDSKMRLWFKDSEKGAGLFTWDVSEESESSFCGTMIIEPE